MSDKSAVIRGSEKTLRYLDNATDAAARQEILDEARKSGLVDTALSLITHKATYHTGENLSPASGIACDGKGRIVVSDEFNHRLIVYDDSGKKLREVGKQGGGDTEFHYPRGLTFDDRGNLYVADAWNHRVVIYGPDFSFSGSIGKLGDGDGELDEPVGVAWHDGRLAVLEKSNHRVHLFGAAGEPLGTIGMRGSVTEQEQFYLVKTLPANFSPPVFEFPSAIAIDSAGNLYVADTNNHRIVKLTPDYQPDSAYMPLELRYPTGLSCDKNDNLHVTQFNRPQVAVFSPDGIMLYGYTPSGIELPVAIAVNSESVYVGAGMQAGISVNRLEPDTEEDFAREEDFFYHFKKAAALFRAGDFDAAIERLSLASNVPAGGRPTAIRFAASLPENDYAFKRGGVPKEPAHAEPFVKILDAFSETLWAEVSALFEKKLAAADEYSGAMLRLEKALLAGTEDDAFMVDRYRAIKKVFSLSSEIKSALAGFKKLGEFRRRLAYIGIGTGPRLDQIAKTVGKITEWKKKREQWYEVAEKEAPTLTFESPPDARESFVLNETRLDYFGFDFRVLWEIAGDFNREIASLIRKDGWSVSPLLEKLFFKAVDFYLFCPDDCETRLYYFRSLEELFDAMGEEKITELVKGITDKTLWDLLVNEENIPHKTKPELYRFLPALWSAGGLSCDGELSADGWEKIVDFYHAEFARYVKENTPLRTELIRNGQLLPAAEKIDKKQAALIQRKLGLLRFHNYYQERYIGNTVLEYVVRFALFALEKSPLPPAAIDASLKELDKTIKRIFTDQQKAMNELMGLLKKIETETNAVEKNRATLNMETHYLGSVYGVMVNAHLAPAYKLAAGRKGGKPFSLKPRRRIAGADTVSARFYGPGIIAFDEKGRLYCAATASSTLFMFDEKGGFLNSFGGYGSAPGRLLKPSGLIVTPDGELLVTQVLSSTVSLFTADGGFIRRFALEADGERKPRIIQLDSKGRLFVSFIDGGGLSVYDLQGRLLEKIEPGDTPLGADGKIHGFCINDDRLYLAGKGQLYLCGLNGKEIKSVACDETGCEWASSMAVDKSGNLYAVGFKQNLLIKVDPEFKTAHQMGPLPTHEAVGVAVSEKTLALSDTVSDTVWFFDL